MKKAWFFVACVLMGALSVVLSELLLVQWILKSPLDVSGHFMLLGIMPVEFVVVGIACAVLWKVLKHNLVLYLGVYWAAFVVLHGLELEAFKNPVGDIVRYWIGISFGVVVWWGILRARLRV